MITLRMVIIDDYPGVIIDDYAKDGVDQAGLTFI